MSASSLASSGRSWVHEDGLKYLQALLTKLTFPRWPHGPHDWQVLATARLLAGRNQILVIPCSGGKTSISYLAIIVLVYHQTRNTPLPFSTPVATKIPISLMISPLADLGLLQAEEIRGAGLSAVTLDHDSLSAPQGNPLEEAKKCQHSVIIATPERVQTPAFNSLLRVRAKTKLANMIFAYFIDEAHAFVQWGQTWRPAYKAVMRVVSCLRANTPIIAMTATLSSENEKKLVKELNFRAGQWDLIRRATTKLNVRTVYLPLTHGLGGKSFPDITWVVPKREKVIIYVSTIAQCNDLAFYLYKFFPEGREARLRAVRVYNAFQSSATNRTNLEAFLNDPDTYIIIATIKLGLGADTKNVVTVIILGLPQTIEDDEQERGRAGRGGEIKAASYTYVQQAIIKAVRDAHEEPKKRAGAARKPKNGDNTASTRNEKLVAVENKKVKHALDNYCPGLVRTVSALTKNTCLDGELDGVFANPGAKSGLHCFHQQRQYPCSSCMWRLNEARKAQGLLPTPDTQPTSSTTEEQTHAPDHHSGPADAGDVDVDAAATRPSAANKQRATTNVMRLRVESALVDFCNDARAELPDSSNSAAANRPISFFFPYDLRSSLLDAFSAARNREVFDEILASWAHMATHGDVLHKLVVALNVAFDKFNGVIRNESSASRAATLKAKKDAATMAEDSEEGSRPEEKLTIRLPPLSQVRAAQASSLRASVQASEPRTPSKSAAARSRKEGSSPDILSPPSGGSRKRRLSIDENVNVTPSKHARLFSPPTDIGLYLSPTASPSRKRRSGIDDNLELTPTKRRRETRHPTGDLPLPAPRFK